MTRTARRVEFVGHKGHMLAGIVELPSEPARGFLVFSHCFTCNKDLKVIVRISRALADRGWAVLRYDFAGLGNSQGDFSQTNFSTNQIDLQAAVHFVSSEYQHVDFLVGHSFGGAASLSMADSLDVKGVITLAAPSDTQHLASLLVNMDPNIEALGHGTVTIGGRSYRIDRQMVQDFRSHDLPSIVQRMKTPLLAIHAPSDETVGFCHAIANCGFNSQSRGVNTSPFQRSLICLDGANHLLTSNDQDCGYVAQVIDVWCQRWM